MIDEPVVKASDSFTNPNCGVVQMTISSARRAGGRQGFQREIARRDAVQRVGGRPVEAEGGGRRVPVDGEGRAGQGRGAQRALVHPRPGVGEAAGVAAEHLHIGHHVVAEGHRLGRLQVREAGHQRVRVRLGLGQQGALQRLDLADGAVAGVTNPKAEVERHLVVARARGVQPPGRRADQLAQPRLHVHVDVFVLVAEGKGPGGDLRLDGRQPALDSFLVGA
jgi:hypothetical protein